MKFTAPPGLARSRMAATPAKHVKQMLVDRETKYAVAGVVPVFVMVMMLAHSASPAPARHEAIPRLGDTVAPASARPVKMVQAAPTVADWGHMPQQPAMLTVTYAKPRSAAPFFYKGTTDDRERAVNCLAAAAWYEAGNDPEGQRSVMQVVLNRVRHPTFPSSVCGVVFEGSERTTGCQFTFTCDGSMQRRFPSAQQWSLAQKLAEKALTGSVDDTVGQATHYHADYVSPWWSGALQQVSQIGAHIFYRWPGGQGHLARNRNAGAEANEAELAQGRPRPETQGEATALLAPQMATLDAAASAPVIPVGVSQAQLIGLDPNSPSSPWAVTALSQCLKKPACTVMGYGQGLELSRNTNLVPAQMERPLFLFVRDRASGMEVILWDCDRTARPSEDQCLPKDRKSLDQLMRNR
ncbi:cell wall hydrolase [Novosphingobium mathurense]|uniref:Cell wall hydrolase CwlJ, involved in spore germination n=1 Tax=Novosphingobium mathurense TaxID=428990 RepID=A0A1U6HMF8_9SPHN|nr:cell wall hydrolase [Novosphingobium mathurense]SLJ96962.1 Cell wall hydrolase CwlJ, involved in spore germination [Novosphingobium mathurense]